MVNIEFLQQTVTGNSSANSSSTTNSSPDANVTIQNQGASDTVDLTGDGAVDGADDGAVDGVVDGAVDGAVDGSIDGMMDGSLEGSMGGDMIGEVPVTSAKGTVMSSWPFVIGITSVTLVLSIVIGILLAKKRIKKGLDLYED